MGLDCPGGLSASVEDRNAYLAALDRASIDGDIEPFAGFIAERVRWSMERKGERNPEA